MKCALITGGTSGIGAATADTLLHRGWRVAIVGRTAGPLSRHRFAWPERVLPVRLDVGAPDAAGIACDRVLQEWGQLDLLVNNAAANRHSPLERLSTDDWNFVISVNLTAAFSFMQAAAGHMLRQNAGSIVNVSSVSGVRGNPDRSAYAASKAALDSLTRSGAVAWATRGIRVNAVAPGFTLTPPMQASLDRGILDASDMIGRTPMKRLATPSEIASAIAFLAGDEASYITGQILYVDGGFVAYGADPRDVD